MNTVIGDLFDRAERVGAALLICDDQDRIIKVNDKHAEIYDFVDYSTRPTFDQLQLRFIESGRATSQLIYQDPRGWMQAAAQFRRICDYSQFITRHADGRVLLVCYEKVKDSTSWWYQVRIDVTQELKARFTDSGMLIGPACWEGTFAPLTRNSTVPITNVLEAMPAAAGLIMSRGKLLEANQALLTLLRDGNGLAMLDDRVVAQNPLEETELLRRLGRFFQAGGQRVPMAMRISRQDSNEPYFISVSSLFDQEREVWDNSHIGLLTVANPSSIPSIDPRMLMEFLGITLAEAKVAAALGEGHTIVCIARERGVQINTIYAQVKSIVEKTGYSGQTDIARRVSDIARIFGSRQYLRGTG